MTARQYGQACSVARFLDRLGSRWTLLIVRDLLVGPRRFKELLANAPTMGPNLLTSRLQELVELGIAEKDGHTYLLTEAGRDLEPVILAMSRWSLSHLEIDPDDPGKTRPDLLVVAFRAAFNPSLAEGIEDEYEFRIDDVTFFARIEQGELTTELGSAADPDFVLEASSETFDLIGGGALDIGDAEDQGRVAVTGSRAAFNRFVKMFGGA